MDITESIQQLIANRPTYVVDHENIPLTNTANNKSKLFSELTEPEQEMINYIVTENRAFFCHQQINDPDITDEQRRSIVTKVLTSSAGGGKKQFLYRFGAHVREDHLNLIENIPNEKSEDEYEIKFLLADIRRRQKNRLRDIKNRRYTAMQRMLSNEECEYFSEKEMMIRQPLLYEHLIGQYLTDTEKKIRDDFDPNTKFSNVLLNGIEQNQIEELKKTQELEEVRHGKRNDCMEQQENEETDDDTDNGTNDDDEEDSFNDSCHKNGIIDENYYPQTPPSFKKHWGGFDDEITTTATTNTKITTPSSSSSKMLVSAGSIIPKKNKKILANDRKQNYVTLSEKEILRQEFIGIMQANFLTGKDSDFDYSSVDDNADYDDIDLHDQDEEDKYFNEDNDDDDDAATQNMNDDGDRVFGTKKKKKFKRK